MSPTVFVTSHIHIDGPIPGPHSLLTLASAAYDGSRPDEGPISTFTTNVRELPGATLHPIDLAKWRERPEDWLSTRRSSRPAAVAMNAYARWIAQLPGAPTFVADPIEPGYPFLYWYLQRFTGQWPFARTSTDVELHERLTRTPMCRLSGCRTPVRELAHTS
jgi:hypothetical protein